MVNFVNDYWYIWVVALFVAIIVEIMLICNRHLARSSPINYILLAIFTICEAYSVSATSVYYALDSPWIVIESFVGTVAITLACTFYALTTKNDFTILGSMAWLVVSALLFCIIIMAVTHFTFFLYDLLIAFCVFLFGIYLIVDVQMIVGSGRWKLSVDDYILGALILFVDIITIFLYLLSLFGGR
jgi:FtsH-binding integral membrane protein